MATLTTKPLSWFKVASLPRKRFDEAEIRQLGEFLREEPEKVLVEDFRPSSVVGAREALSVTRRNTTR